MNAQSKFIFLWLVSEFDEHMKIYLKYSYAINEEKQQKVISAYKNIFYKIVLWLGWKSVDVGHKRNFKKHLFMAHQEKSSSFK